MENTEHPDFVTTYKSVVGWKSVLLTWTEDEEIGDMYEPLDTGYFAFDDEKNAIVEAKAWAEMEEIEYRERKGEM